METIYVAGGCLWGVQHFFNSLPGVISTEAGRANGTGSTLDGPYDGYAECVKVTFAPDVISVSGLMTHLFEIIDPYSVDHQGFDTGHKYRTGIYSTDDRHLSEARAFLSARDDYDRIAVEVLPLTNYVRSADEHQNHLARCPEDNVLCHIPFDIMNRYRKTGVLRFRRSTAADADACARIGAEGKAILKIRGVSQWQRGTYPDKALFLQDAETGIGYVVTEDLLVSAVCAVTFTDEPSYRNLHEGAWFTPEGSLYATIHRSAVSAARRGRGLSTFLFDSACALARENGAKSVRVDTHPDNIVMQAALAKAGFTKCCEMVLVDGDEIGDIRWGYEKLI